MNREEKEESLVKARLEYPLGTVFLCAYDKSRQKVTRNHNILDEDQDDLYIDGGQGFIVHKNEWAEIISTPQPQEDVTKMEKKPQFEVLGFCNKGDVVVSLAEREDQRNLGQMLLVERCSSKYSLYYKSITQGEINSSDESSWRLATKEETDAYHRGVRNISEFVAAQEDNWEPKVGEWVVILQNLGDLNKCLQVSKRCSTHCWFKETETPYTHELKQLRKALPHEIPSNQEPKQINSQLNVKHNGTTEGKTIKTNPKTAKVTSGKRSTGRTVSGRRGRSTVAVGHLSHKTITGS